MTPSRLLLDPESELFLAPRTDKSGGVVTTPVKSGNPWRDPSSGTFTNGPPGVRVTGGAAILKALSNEAKQYISNLQKRAHGDSISATQDKDGRVTITLLGESGQQITSFKVAGGAVAPDKAAPDGDALAATARRRDLVADVARIHGELDAKMLKREMGDRVAQVSDEQIVTVLVDAHVQRMSDIVDYLSDRYISRDSKQTIQVTGSPDGVRQTLSGFDDQEHRQIVGRVAARGLSQPQAEKLVLQHLSKDAKAKVVADAPEKDKEATTPAPSLSQEDVSPIVASHVSKEVADA